MPRDLDRPHSSRTTALGCLVFCSLLVASSAAQLTSSRTCLAGARLLDARLGRYLDAAGVLIEGDRIAAIYRLPAELPDGVERIDLHGATLVPGLSDLHATAAPTAAADADYFYTMALAYGVTTLRVVDAPTPWAIAQRTRARRGDILSPRLWIAGPPLPPSNLAGPGTRPGNDVVAATRDVNEQARAGVDFVRAHGMAAPEAVRALVAAAATKRLRTSAEPGVTSALDLSRLGLTFVDRLAHLRGTLVEPIVANRLPAGSDEEETAADLAWEKVTESDIKAFAAGMLRSRTGLVPLLAANRGVLDGDSLARDPAVALLPARWRQELAARPYPPQSPAAGRAASAAAVRARALAAAARAGVRIATGTDVSSSGYNVPGAGIHRELALLVAAGLSPAEAIRAATVNGAELLGAASSIGQLRVGFKADLFAVDGDPLQHIEDLLRVRLVVRGGEVLDRDELLREAGRARR